MRNMFRVLVVLVIGIAAAGPATAQMTFSIDFQGPTPGGADGFGFGIISEGDILTVPVPLPPGPNAPVPGPFVVAPGIEIGAPERTLTSSGASGSPKRRPIVSSSRPRWDATSSSTAPGTVLPAASNMPHTDVAIVKPGGTGSPIRHISARFAPLPPSSGLRDASPSASSREKK